MISNPSQLIKNNILICPIHTKTKDQIVHICFQPDCKAQPLLCMKCAREDQHKGHNTISFFELAQLIEQFRFDESVFGKVQNMEKEAKNAKTTYLSLIRNFKETVVKQITQVEKAVEEYFCKVSDEQKMLIGRLQSLNLKQFEMRDKETVESLTREVKEQRTTYFANKDMKQEITVELSNMQQSLSEQNQEVKASIKQLDEEITKVLNSLPLYLKTTSAPKPKPIQKQILAAPKDRWNASSKHSILDIKGQTLIRKDEEQTDTDSNCIGCLGFIDVDGKQTKSYEWTIKIIKIQRPMYIGIGSEKLIAQNNFVEWSWSSIGHGLFCICSDGYVISNQNKEINLERKAFLTQAGDIIKIVYEPSKSKLMFSNNKQQRYEMDVTSKEKYKFCAFLRKAGDAIELIN